jgi:hypothetical protein
LANAFGVRRVVGTSANTCRRSFEWFEFERKHLRRSFESFEFERKRVSAFF